MVKTSVKVEIPTKRPDDLITLGEKIYNRNVELAANSPLTSFNMTTFNTALKTAKDKRAQARKLHDEAEKLNQEANLELGLDSTQNSKTPDTVLTVISSVRDMLLGLNRGKEEALNDWGFKVVNGSSAKRPGLAKTSGK